jgi:hypothetical protein
MVMSKSRREKRKARRPRAKHLTSRGAGPTTHPPYLTWPVVRCYVPLADVWHASGFGSAGVIRQRPEGDGKLISAFFEFSLIDGGLKGMIGKDETTDAEEREFLDSLKDLTPRMQPGSLNDLSRFVWGAYGMSLENDYVWPKDQLGRYLNMVPKLSGTPHWWAQQFVQMAPPELWNVVSSLPDDIDVPENQELAVFNEVIFHLDGDHADAVRKLAARRPEFAIVDEAPQRVMFDWSREYPKNHWSPLRLVGGRQSLGSVLIEPQQLSISTKTLSMAAVLVGKLKGLFGEAMAFKAGEWTDPASLAPNGADDFDDEEDDDRLMPAL